MRKAKSVFIPASRCQFRGKDLTGKKFHRLRVVAFAGKGKNSRPYWRCVCKCGNECIVVVDNLKARRTRSCGCFGSERHAEIRTIHGGFGTPEFNVWMGMRQRCSNPKLKGYKDYGGRGIRVCSRWQKSFANFLKDMGRRPSPKHSIDRFPDNNGHYCKSNCRWATRREQYNNRRSNRFVILDGLRDTVANHARRTRIKYSTLLYRISRISSDATSETKKMLKLE